MFINKLLNITVFLLLVSLYTGCTDNNAGGTIETTNGVVAGVISDTITSGTEEAIIQLVPSNFNPIENSFELIYSDTLSSNSSFEFKNLPPNKYNIEIRTSESNLRAFYGTIDVDNSIQNVDTIHLNYCGSLLLTELPDSLNNIEKLFIKGTTFFWDKNSVLSNDSIFIPELPASILPPLKYVQNNEANDITIDLNIQSNDTLTLKAFTFLVHVNGFNMPLPSNKISTLVTDAQGVVWIGFYENGFCIRTKISWEFFKVGISNSKLQSDSITSITTGISAFNDTVCWLGTTNGIVKRRIDSVETLYNSGNISYLSSNNIKALEYDNVGGIWIGTDSGLVHFDESTSQYYPTPFMSKEISFCKLDQNNVLWIGNTEGSAMYSGSTWSIKTTTPVVAMASLSIQKEIWIAHNDGSISISNDGSAISKTLSSEYNIQTIFEASDSIVYIGTDKGVILYHNDQFSTLNPDVFINLESYSITAITEDQNNNMWFGTQNNGIIIIGPTALEFK